MNKTCDEETLREFHESLSNVNVTTVYAAENHIEQLKEVVNYEAKAREYADKRGIIFYELEGNTMTYEEQVKNGPRTYGLYTATVNLDTDEVTQKEVK